MGRTPTETAEQHDDGEQEALFVFEGLSAERQFVKLTGVSALEISDTLEDGDEVELTVRGVVQDQHFKTRSRGRKDTSAKIRTVTQSIKVDSAKITRSVPKLVK